MTKAELATNDQDANAESPPFGFRYSDFIRASGFVILVSRRNPMQRFAALQKTPAAGGEPSPARVTTYEFGDGRDVASVRPGGWRRVSGTTSPATRLAR